MELLLHFDGLNFGELPAMFLLAICLHQCFRKIRVEYGLPCLEPPFLGDKIRISSVGFKFHIGIFQSSSSIFFLRPSNGLLYIMV